MFGKFANYVKEKEYFHSKQKILLAISGGVDSMVLLRFMEKLAEKEQFFIGVAHINHKIREESDAECQSIARYCQQHQIPFFGKEWLAENKEKNMEARARKFRYDFFAEIMAMEDYSILLTAHHRDDQAETIIMKLTRGSGFSNFVGIREKQSFKNGQLIRPLLIFSKEELESYAEEKQLMFFEDSTNQTNLYMRNRIRHQVIPVLKKENVQFLQHIAQFSEQIQLADDLIESVVKPKYNQWVQKQEHGWSIDLGKLKKERDSFQIFFMNTLLQETIIKKNVEIKQVQLHQLLKVINQSTPQLKVELESGWVFIKEYDIGYLLKKSISNQQESFRLNLLENLYLSENEWLGLETSNHPLTIPNEVSDWQQFSCCITSDTALPLIVRHRKDGDRVALKQGLTKKLNRLFIDRKTPNLVRNQTWIILSAEQEIIWVPKFANSYLSIPTETDKIHYRLLYRTKE